MSNFCRATPVPFEHTAQHPDLRVARKLVDGAFHEAIRAAKPLQYGLIIDAGGYIGTAAIAFANAFPDALVISLEPSRHNFEMLRKNTKHLPNVIALNEALGSRVETATLSDRNTGEWGFTVVKNPLDCPAPQALHDTLTTTIPQLLRAVGKGGIIFSSSTSKVQNAICLSTNQNGFPRPV